MYSPACKMQINLSDLYDAKTMYSDHVSSHCYCLLAFPLIYLGRGRKTFPFSGHCLRLPFPVNPCTHPSEDQRDGVKLREAPQEHTAHLPWGFWKVSKEKNLLSKLPRGAFKPFTQITDNPKPQFWGKYCIDKPTSCPASQDRLSSKCAQVHQSWVF